MIEQFLFTVTTKKLEYTEWKILKEPLKNQFIIENKLKKMKQLKNHLKSFGISVELIQPNTNIFHYLKT